MIKNNQLKEDFILLVKNEKWDEVRSWFHYWSSEEDLVDKVIIWCRFFMKEYFYDTTPEFHRDIIKAFFSEKNEFKAAPRGFSKTSTLQGCIAFTCAHKLKNFLVLVEKNFTEGSEVLDGVRTVFVDNNLIVGVYGKLIGKLSDSDAKDKDSQGDLLINGVRLRAKGFDSPIRGMKYNQYRPDIIVLDDCETDEHISSPEQRLKNMNKYNKAIVPAVDINGSIKVYGTILHFDSLLNNLIKWHGGKIYRAYNTNDPRNTLLWPERWSYEKLMQKKKDMETQGRGSSAFSQEYLNDPVDEEQRKFKQSWLWNPEREFTYEQIAGKTLYTLCAIDPAESKLEGSDWTGVIVVAIDDEDNWYFLYVKRLRVDIKELLDHIFFVWREFSRFGITRIGLAKKAFEYQIKPLLNEEKNRRQQYPIVEQLDEMGRNKQERILGALQGRAELGKLWFRKNADDDTEKLRHELYEFPSSQNDDLSDGSAFISDMKKITGGISKARGIPINRMKVPDYSGGIKNLEDD